MEYGRVWNPPLRTPIIYVGAGPTAQPLAALPPYGWGVPLAGKTTFSFDSKEKAVLDSEKEKVDQWK